MQVQLGNGGSSSWSTSSTWLPLFLEAQPLEEVLSRCRQGSTQVATSVCVGRLIYFCGMFFKSWLIMINNEQQCVDEWCCQKSYFYPKDHYFASLRHFHCNSATPREAKTGHLQLPCRAESRASLKGTCTAWFFLVLFRCSGLHMELRKVSWVCPAPYRGRAFHILPISQSFIICKAICIEHVREHSEHCIEYVLNSYKFIVLGRLRSLKKALQMDTNTGLFFRSRMCWEEWCITTDMRTTGDDLVCTGSLQNDVILHELHVPSFIEGQFRWNDTICE